jgi:hypothetical protein
MLFQTMVDEITILPALTQDDTINAGESDNTVEKAVGVEPNRGDDRDEGSNSSSNSDSDREDETPYWTTEPTGDGECHTTTR